MSEHEPRVASGSDGADPIRRLYRRSPLRRLIKIDWDHRGLRPNDVFLASYPRSGSAWLRFLLLEMTRGDASFEGISRDLPYVGRHHQAASLLPNGGRFVKTHEAYLPVYRRAIHLVRDPRDVAISYFRFMQRIQKIRLGPVDDEAASFDHFIDALITGRVDAHGTWQSHLLSWFRAREARASDILRVRYEDLRADTPTCILSISEWLGLSLARDDAARVAARCSLERMHAAEAYAVANAPYALSPRAIRSGVPLVNTGRVAGWRAALTDEQQRRFGAFAEGLTLMGYPAATGD